MCYYLYSGDFMKIMLNNVACECLLCTNISDRFKLFRFKLNEIRTGLCLPHKRKGNTYLFCQRVDVFLVDDEFKIIKIIRNIKTEKFIFGNKLVYYMFFVPTNKFMNAGVGDKFKIILNDNEKDILDTYNKRYLEKYLAKKKKILKKLEKKKVPNK